VLIVLPVRLCEGSVQPFMCSRSTCMIQRVPSGKACPSCSPHAGTAAGRCPLDGLLLRFSRKQLCGALVMVEMNSLPLLSMDLSRIMLSSVLSP
jgi:hypothetical protein